MIPSPLSQAHRKVFCHLNENHSSRFSGESCWNIVFQINGENDGIETETHGRYSRIEEQVKMFFSYKNSHWCLALVHL